jgi:hypothetical protein
LDRVGKPGGIERLISQVSESRPGAPTPLMNRRDLGHPPMTLPAQVLFLTINQHSTPWIWSVIEFSSSGSASSAPTQIFPTYYIYINGALVNGPSPTQGPLANFTVLNGTNSQMTPTQIQ